MKIENERSKTKHTHTQTHQLNRDEAKESEHQKTIGRTKTSGENQSATIHMRNDLKCKRISLSAISVVIDCCCQRIILFLVVFSMPLFAFSLSVYMCAILFGFRFVFDDFRWFFCSPRFSLYLPTNIPPCQSVVPSIFVCLVCCRLSSARTLFWVCCFILLHRMWVYLCSFVLLHFLWKELEKLEKISLRSFLCDDYSLRCSFGCIFKYILPLYLVWLFLFLSVSFSSSIFFCFVLYCLMWIH